MAYLVRQSLPDACVLFRHVYVKDTHYASVFVRRVYVLQNSYGHYAQQVYSHADLIPQHLPLLAM